MTNEEILNRIDKIRSISKKEISNPPASIVIAIDGEYISASLYDEYSSLINEKISKNILSSSEQAKLEQLSYIKDKMQFIQKKAKSSIDAIYIIPDDIEEYVDALHLYNDLSKELSFILSHNFSIQKVPSKEESINNETPELSIDSAVFLPKNKKVKISLDDVNEEYSIQKDLENSNENKQIEKDETEKKDTDDTKNEETLENANFKLFQDLADIDKILGNISFTNNKEEQVQDDKEIEIKQNNTSSKFYIGSIVSPNIDVTSYNDSSVVAKKGLIYRIVSFVALDKSDIVVDSSSSLNLSYREFSSSHPTNAILFILSKEPQQSIDYNEWSNRDISLDLPNCIGSFSNLSLFSNILE